MTYGPIDFIAIEFETHQLKGEVIPELLELVHNKIIRVVDLVIVRKENGNYQVLEIEELTPDIKAIFASGGNPWHHPGRRYRGDR
ncbi:MAG: hypothetical protein U9R58_12015 [Chloroflexota bacterium]|nr:hypothetical protein [Chloroflexota bacterium]